jgi:hypothetical protein
MSLLSLRGDFGHVLLNNVGTIKDSGDYWRGLILHYGHETLEARGRMLWFRYEVFPKGLRVEGLVPS